MMCMTFPVLFNKLLSTTSCTTGRSDGRTTTPEPSCKNPKVYFTALCDDGVNRTGLGKKKKRKMEQLGVGWREEEGARGRRKGGLREML